MNRELESDRRIDILDGFRAIAILAVVLYHYYYCCDGKQDGVSLYQYPAIDAFKYGFYGVQLFFVISGFVIYRSLQRSSNASDFLAKRYMRLLPAMVLCSLISYLVLSNWIVDEEFEQLRPDTPLSFLFSLTFIHPRIWAEVFQQSEIGTHV